MRELEFQFLYKGLPFSSVDSGCNWFKKIYTINQMINVSVRDLSDVHNQADLIAVRQCTGLKDKNGVKIFEGDIVCVHRDHPELNAVIKRNKECASFGCYLCNDNSKEIYCDHLFGVTSSEVIGNIYQDSHLLGSPELLEE